MGEPVRPIEHISIRVPWHDAGWNGRVCHDPLGNGTCVLLANIGHRRKDAHEQRVAGRAIDELPLADAPPCVAERGTFMSPRPIQLERVHPFVGKNEAYRHFLPTRQVVPAYSAQAVPFRWMSRQGAEEVSRERQLDLRPELEAIVDALTGWKNTTWMMHGENQRTILDAFFETVQPERSLVFFYAKHSPLSEDTRRLLVGAAMVRNVSPTGRYRSDGGASFPSEMWETTIEHSLRPDQREGFLMPYQALLAARDRTGEDIDDALALAPEGGWESFSYVTEHVSHDLAVDALLALQAAGRRAQRILGDEAGPLGFDWLELQLNRLWKLRGPCPGLASALAALGVPRPVTFAHMVEAAAGADGDPWLVVDRAMADPDAFSLTAREHLTPSLRALWQGLPRSRRELLELLSRFAMTPAQARRFYVVEERDPALTDEAILANPYLIFETDRTHQDCVPFTVIDRGCFPDAKVAVTHPLSPPSAMVDRLDPRRVRALVIDELHRAEAAGHTVCRQDDVVRAVAGRQLSEPCPVSGDLLDVHGLSAGTLPPARR